MKEKRTESVLLQLCFTEWALKDLGKRKFSWV